MEFHTVFIDVENLSILLYRESGQLLAISDSMASSAYISVSDKPLLTFLEKVTSTFHSMPSKNGTKSGN